MDNLNIASDNWTFSANCPESRLSVLNEPISFDQLTDRICDGISILCGHVTNCDDRPTFNRVICCGRIGPALFDLLFNSRFGIRAAYFTSPEHGILANGRLLQSLIPKLIDWVHENRSAIDPKFVVMNHTEFPG